MSLEDAIQRNRERQAAKRAGLPADRPQKGLKAYRVSIITNPPVFMIELGLAKPERKTITVYGTSKRDAMERAGIQ
jgi:hypothetical protein